MRQRSVNLEDFRHVVLKVSMSDQKKKVYKRHREEECEVTAELLGNNIQDDWQAEFEQNLQLSAATKQELWEFLKKVSGANFNQPWSVLMGMSGFYIRLGKKDSPMQINLRFRVIVWTGSKMLLAHANLAEDFAYDDEWMKRAESQSKFVFASIAPVQGTSSWAYQEHMFTRKDTVRSSEKRCPFKWSGSPNEFQSFGNTDKFGLGMTLLVPCCVADVSAIKEDDKNRTLPLYLGGGKFAKYVNFKRSAEIKTEAIVTDEKQRLIFVNPKPPIVLTGNGEPIRPYVIFTHGYSGIYSFKHFKSMASSIAPMEKFDKDVPGKMPASFDTKVLNVDV